MMLTLIPLFVMNVRHGRLLQFKERLKDQNIFAIHQVNAYETATDEHSVSQMNITSPLNNQNVGLLLAHKLVWTRILAKEWAITAFAEDDVNFRYGDIDWVAELVHDFELSTCDIVYFGTRKDLYFEEKYWQMSDTLMGVDFRYPMLNYNHSWFSTFAFILKRKTIDVFTREIDFQDPIDIAIGRLISESKVTACFSRRHMLEEVDDAVHDTQKV